MGTPCTPYNRGLTRKENNKIYVREEVGVECPTGLGGRIRSCGGSGGGPGTPSQAPLATSVSGQSSLVKAGAGVTGAHKTHDTLPIIGK
jgi:hypothetical protein